MGDAAGVPDGSSAIGRWEAARARQPTAVQRGAVARWATIALLVVALLWLLWYTFITDMPAWLRRMDELGSVVGGGAILFATWRYVVTLREARDRDRRANHYRAWQVISGAQGKPGNGGRLDAVTELARDGVVLDGVNLDGAWLNGLSIPPGGSLRDASFLPLDNVGASLQGARLALVNMMDAKLERANLADADLSHSILDRAAANGALLRRANLRDASMAMTLLGAADLSHASLHGVAADMAYFDQACLLGANLTAARLRRARLTDCVLWQANIVGADLSGADLRGARVEDLTWGPTTRVDGANVKGLRDDNKGFRLWALTNGAKEDGGNRASVLFNSVHARFGRGEIDRDAFLATRRADDAAG